MKQGYDSTESRKGKHLTYEERIKIEALSRSGLTPTEIGKQIAGRTRRTIERELARGATEHKRMNPSTSKSVNEPMYIIEAVYSAQIGQQRHDELASNKGPGLKIGNDHELAG